MHTASNTVYPIIDAILCLLADDDMDWPWYQRAVDVLRQDAPADVQTLLDENVDRLQQIQSSDTGVWNQEEMVYYDHEVEDAALRQQMVERIQGKPLLHIFLERNRHLVAHLRQCQPRKVLEVGGGNSRTIYGLYRPADNDYMYIGTDIAFKRLLVAKAVIPEGDFVQCSALNLPFKRNQFDGVVAFGMMHHLPDPMKGVREAVDCLAEGGCLILHEPVERPTLIPDVGYDWLKKLLATYEHSEHDNTVNVENLMSVLAANNCTILHRHFSGSALRTILQNLYGRVTALKYSNSAWETLLTLDQAFIKLFCQTPNQLGPKAIYVAAQKNL